jgi:hypothetical protein
MAQIIWLVCVGVPLASPNVLFQYYTKYYYTTLGITDHATEERDVQTSHVGICLLFELRL